MKSEQRRLKKEYLETPRPMGILRIRNTAQNVSALVASVDMPASINRFRFQLELGSHPDRQLQEDWKRLGADAFAFEVLDELKPAPTPGRDDRAELQELLALWREKLRESGERLYS